METKNRKFKTDIDIAIINNVIAYTKSALNQYNIIGVWLFGSFAKGTANENSDIDIALVFDSLKDKFQAQFELMKIRRKFDYRIEPHPLDEKEFTKQNQFADEILNTGLQIFRYEKEKGTQHWLVAT